MIFTEVSEHITKKHYRGTMQLVLCGRYVQQFFITRGNIHTHQSCYHFSHWEYLDNFSEIVSACFTKLGSIDTKTIKVCLLNDHCRVGIIIVWLHEDSEVFFQITKCRICKSLFIVRGRP